MLLLQEMPPGGKTVDRSHLNCIKHSIYCSNEPMIQIKAIDALAAYGKQAIDHITEIINSPGLNSQVKTHALVAIETIKKS